MTKVSTEIGSTVLLSILTGGDPGIINEISKSLLSSGFSRSMEKEADVFAYDLLQKAHINPSNLTTCFIRLKSNEQMDTDNLELIKSHPNLKNRITYLSELKLDSTFTKTPINLDWEALQNSVNQ